MMNRLIVTIAAAGALLPAAAGAQAHDPVADAIAVIAEPQARPARPSDARRQQEEMRERQREIARRNLVEQSEKIERTLKLGARGELSVANLSGDISITRGSGSDVRVQAVKTAYARTAEEARQMLSWTQVEFSERGSRSEIRVVHSRNDGNRQQEEGRVIVRRNTNVSVAFTITAPENARISVNTMSGSITVTGIKGELSLVALSGNVSVADAGRIANARSTSGNVVIADTRSEVPVEATTISGNVTVRKVSAPSIQIEAVSGDLRLEDVESRRVEAQSVTGTIDLASPLQKNGRYDIQSHGGTIRVAVAGNVGFELDAQTFSGSIRSEVPLKDEETSAGPGMRRTSGSRIRSLRGIHGDGSALLDITTFSGNVIITRK